MLLIKSGEGKRVSFFIGLLLLLGAGMAIGRGSADVMFLKRYGIEYLPVMYLILSIVLAVCFTLYAAFVDRVSSERFFYFLLSIEIIALLGFWYVILFTDITSVYPAYFIFYELVSELILVHATFYIAQSFDTLQSKRLTSLILAGYQSGMIIGGLFFALVMPMIGVEHSMLVWSGLLMLSLLTLFAWHRKYGVSPFYMPQSKSGGSQIYIAVQEVAKGLQFVRQSALLRNASYALFFMVLMFYVLTYSVNKIYSESFESEAELALFFGVLVAVTNFLAVLFQTLVSGRVIERLGVRKAKLIFPVMTVISYVLLLISPGFYMALIASVNNSAIMPAFRNPTRQMFFNVLPDYVKGRARATSVALVLPLALFVCGVLILYLQTSDSPVLIMYFGFFCALMYWYFCFRMGKVYSSTLIKNLKTKLYLPADIPDAAYRGNNDSLYPVLLKGLSSDDEKVCVSYAALLIKTFPEKSVQPIMANIKLANIDVADQLIRLIGHDANEAVLSELMDLIDSGDDHLKATIYDVLHEHGKKDNRSIIETSLSSSNSRIRASGIKAAMRRSCEDTYQRGLTQWCDMLQGNWQQKMAVIDMQPLLASVDEPQAAKMAASYSTVLSSLLSDAKIERRKIIYVAVAKWSGSRPEEISHHLEQDMLNVDATLRRAATTCLHRLAESQHRKDLIWAMLADGHGSVRKAALKVMVEIYQQPMDVYFAWLMDGEIGTPRAQKTLLSALIEQGIARNKLVRIADRKVAYAAELLSALNLLLDHKDHDMKMMRTVLEERLEEMIDLVLLAIEPMMEAGSIAVVRAGLSSKNMSAMASAHEALRGIKNQQLAAILSHLIDRDNDKSEKLGHGKQFSDKHDVLRWCAEVGDAWLRECGRGAIMAMDDKTYA